MQRTESLTVAIAALQNEKKDIKIYSSFMKKKRFLSIGHVTLGNETECCQQRDGREKI